MRDNQRDWKVSKSEGKKNGSSKEPKLTPSKWKYCWLNAKCNTSVMMARQAEPQQHTENIREWDLQTRSLLNKFTDN